MHKQFDKKRLFVPLIGLLVVITVITFYYLKTLSTETPPATETSTVKLYSGMTPEVTPYESPKINLTNDGLEIDTEKSGGVFLNYKLDPLKKYIIKIDGTVYNKALSLVIQRDAQPKSWSSILNGVNVFSISKTQKLSMLLYNDIPFKYLLKSVSVDTCEDCIETIDLQNAFSKTLPALDKIQSYNQVLIKNKNGHLIENADNYDGGVYFSFNLDPTRKYQLILDGKNISGQAVLQTTKDAGTPVSAILTAPQTTLTLSGTHHFKMLIYSGTTFQYLLKNLTLEECSTCETDNNPKT